MHDAHIAVERHATSISVDDVSDLLERANVLHDEPALSEGKWLDLVHGGRHGFVAATAYVGDWPMIGYAQATRGSEGWGLEVVTDPAADPDGVLRRALVETMVVELRDAGGRVHYWVNRPDAESDSRLESLGLAPDRELLEMRVPLPLAMDESNKLTVRPFRPGTDDESWLRINNRAFVDHPEQGGWDLETLRERQAEPWFDPRGFLVHEVDGRIAGTCWTKVHGDTSPPMGEIYVISVDPAFQGKGLGLGLTVAGLDWLAGRDLTVGMLYTTASNVVALGLYRSLGFTVHRIQRVYTTTSS